MVYNSHMNKRLVVWGVLLLLLAGSAGPLRAGSAEAQEISVPEKLGVDLEGKIFNLKDHLGKENLYLVFWATWCGVCADEIPNLVNVHRNSKGVNLVAVNPGVNDSLQRARKYRDKYQLPYTIVFDETGLSAQAFGVSGVPTAVLIDKRGEVVYAGFPPSPDKVSEIFSQNPQ